MVQAWATERCPHGRKFTLRLLGILKGRTSKAYRVNFDSYMIRSSCRVFNLDTAWMETCQWEDMKLFMNSATRISRELVTEYEKATNEPA